MPYLWVESGKIAGRRVALRQESFFIGRDSGNQLVIPDRTVSRKHAVINWVDSHYVLTDLNSLKGTWVQEQKVREITLQEGDTFRVGDVHIAFVGGEMPNPFPRFFSRKRFWIALGLLVGLVLVGWWWRGRSVSEVERWYETGVAAWNVEHDAAKAKEAWETVLQLDPKRKSDAAQKAAKLLELMEKKP